MSLDIREVLHWLPAEQWISYRITSLVLLFLFGLASVSLTTQHGLLFVPFAYTSTKQSHTVSVVGPLDLEQPPF